MRQVTLAGHPLHPQTVAGPIALFPFSAAMDLMYLATGRQCYADAAYYSLVGGYATSMAAGVSGALDYLTISPGGPMKQTANTHAILNLGVVALQTVNLSMRRDRRSGWLPAILSLVGTAGVIVAQWYGGHLVYEHGMRVNPATEKQQPKAKLPVDEAMERGLHRLSEYMPKTGPGSEE